MTENGELSRFSAVADTMMVCRLSRELFRFLLACTVRCVSDAVVKGRRLGFGGGGGLTILNEGLFRPSWR
jgi:hypothetical protein